MGYPQMARITQILQFLLTFDGHSRAVRRERNPGTRVQPHFGCQGTTTTTGAEATPNPVAFPARTVTTY
jgi:hypothetical protein